MKIPLIFTVLSLATLCACSTPQERAAADRRRAAEQLEDDRQRAAEERQRAAQDVAEERRRAAEDLAAERQRAAEDANRLRIYEEEYARSLGKSRSQLTREERQWVRDRYF